MGKKKIERWNECVEFTNNYCTVLYCTVLYCTVLYCTVLYCTVLNITCSCFRRDTPSDSSIWQQKSRLEPPGFSGVHKIDHPPPPPWGGGIISSWWGRESSGEGKREENQVGKGKRKRIKWGREKGRVKGGKGLIFFPRGRKSNQ